MIAATTVDEAAVIAEVRLAFDAYEAALMTYDPAGLDAAFWRDPRVVRFGVAENLYGFDAVAAYRRSRSGVPDRLLQETRIVTFGRDAAVVTTEFTYPGDPRIGRQSQTWIRLAEGWRVVSAHVSFREDVER